MKTIVSKIPSYEAFLKGQKRLKSVILGFLLGPLLPLNKSLTRILKFWNLVVVDQLFFGQKIANV